jgi:cobalt-zinc-cadmium efflux system membrane fusion protein
MISQRISHIAISLIFLCSGLLMAGCEKNNETNLQTTLAAQVQIIMDSNVIEVSRPEDFPLIKAATRMVSEELSVNGSIAPDISRTVTVNGLVGGRIVAIHVRLGDEVKKGQLLLKIHSPDLANAITALKQAKANQLLAQRIYDRNKFLYERAGSVVALKDMQATENALIDAKANTENAITQVKLLSGNSNHPSPFVELLAPISGVIVEQNIALGAAAKSLDATPNLFTIADLSRVWLLCDVYENNLAQVHLGDTARIRLNAYPNFQFEGKVVNIFSILDPNTRSTKVRVELDNTKGILRPGMFATAVFVSQEKIPRIVIQASAIFRLHDKDWVFLPLGGKKFRRSEVQGGATNSDGTLQINTGLKDGDQVVSNALQFSAAATTDNPTAFEEHEQMASP